MSDRPRVTKSDNELSAAQKSDDPRVNSLADDISSGRAADLQDAWVKRFRNQ